MNPIAPGADPWVVHHDGMFFWCESIRDLAIAVYASHDLVSRGEQTIVWEPADKGPFSQQLWAPEMHLIDGRWYIYVSASDGHNRNHRMIVLEGTTSSPLGEFRFKSALYTGDHVETGHQNRWAIDGTVMDYRGSRYFLWSGWADDRDEQWLYIARMENPWTIATNRVQICANDDHRWERVSESMRGRGLNEAPQVLEKDGRVFVIFSASGSWQPSYKLGLLELLADRNPLDPTAWRKHPEPVFQSTKKVYGVGHCSFTRSPDGRQHWMAYHAKVLRKAGWLRAVHVQEFTWTADGLPHFGAPGLPGVPIARPSGCRPRYVNDGQQVLPFVTIAAA